MGIDFFIMPKLSYHIPNSVKGNIIPLSREDYLRQRYQDYLKSQAEKGRKAVVEVREKFQKGGTIPKAQKGTTLQRSYIAKQDATKVLLPLTKKVNQEENEYYNPPIEKGITSGDKRLDFLYNNQWLFDVPIVNDYIRKNAKELASISALGRVDDVEEFKELAKKNNLSYSGHGPGKGLISQYFDQDAFPPSKYKPTSDYLTFLPSYSLKANFESDFTKAQRDDYVSSFIKEGLTSKNDVIATEIPYNDFIKNKKPVYNRYPHANLVSLGNPDLGGHKMGAAWDYTVDLPYVSISDAWDFEPVHYTKVWAAYESEPERQKRRIQSTLLHKAGHPFKIYDRFYFDPKTKEYISDDSVQTLKREKGITPLEDEFLNKDISKYFTDEQSLKKFAKGGTIPKAQEGIITNNKINAQMKQHFATGGQMRKATNSQFLPSYVNGVPVYGFGSWLKKNAGNVLQVAGGVGAMFIPGMQGVGATLIGNGVTGALGQGLQDKQQKDAEAMQRADAERSFMLDQYNDSQQVFASPEGFAKGGSIHIDPSKRGTFTAAATKHGQSVQGFASQVLANKDKYSPAMVKKAVFAHNFAKANGGFVPTYEQGGFMNGLKFYNDGGDIDGLTYFPVGGTHESNPNNGIPLGGNALVEEGEFMWESPTRGKYIFSNRF